MNALLDHTDMVSRSGAAPGTRILLVGLNYAPEQVGIAPYSTELAESLHDSGYSVEVIAAKPYYPAWRVDPAFRRLGYIRTVENGVRLTRCPIFVPATPTGSRRVLHHLSFALAIIVPLLRAIIGRPPALMIVVAPSMMCAPVARLFARLCRAKLWMHIQDFEVGAAFATGLISSRSWKGKLASRFESFACGGFDCYSSISPQMCERLALMGIPESKIFELRNWARIDEIAPMESSESPYRRMWGITTPHVALYSGNIANKQGIDIILEAARRLRARKDLTFVVCGEGPQKTTLVNAAADLDNIVFHDLQPRESLNELLGLATVHLLPQIAGAADLVLPSKLTNMLASGKPVVATADNGTGLSNEVKGCGSVVCPGDAAAFAAAIVAVIDDKAEYEQSAHAARARAFERWSKRTILKGFRQRMSIELQAA